MDIRIWGLGLAFCFVLPACGGKTAPAETAAGTPANTEIDAGLQGSATSAAAPPVAAVPDAPEERFDVKLTAPRHVEIGSSFAVKWAAPNNPRDLIDIAPAGSDDKVEGHAHVLAHLPQPQLISAPATAGAYEVRYVLMTETGPRVLARKPIRVVTADVAILAPETVEIGAPFSVQWRGPNNRLDYVDLVAEDHEGTDGNLAYSLTRTGDDLPLRAPGRAGIYDLRYVAVGSDGKRVLTRVPIEVVGVPAELKFDNPVSLGGTLDVSWTGPGTNLDYIDIVPIGYWRTSGELSYAYTRDANPVTLTLPKAPGEYEVRYIMKAADGERVLAKGGLLLKDVQVDLGFPGNATVGDTLAVDWRGPEGNLNYIDLVPRDYTRTTGELSQAYTRDGNPAVLGVPGEPGDYDVRFILRGSDGERVMRRAPLTVSKGDVSLRFDSRMHLGGVLEVRWSGPEGNLNYVDIVPRGHTKTTGEMSRAFTKDGPLLEMGLPAEPGEYDVRFVLKASDGATILLTRPLLVEDVDTNLAFSSETQAGKTLSVAWEGPNGARDYVDIVPRGMERTTGEIAFANVSDGNPVRVALPAEAGEYDIRYVHAGPDKEVVKAVRPITIY